MPIPYIKDTAEFNAYLASKDAVMVNFTASWCGPCRAILPVIEGYVNAFPAVRMGKVDIDQNQEVASKFQVSSIPTFLFFVKGELVDTVKGGNAQGVKTALERLALAHTAASPVDPSVSAFVPKGFTVMNDSIWFADFQALNARSLTKPSDQADGVKDAFRVGPTSRLVSDADSQLLFHIPFTNISKIYSLLVRVTPPAKVASDAGSTEDLSEAQPPSTIKVWANGALMSFEDAASDAITPLHTQTLTASEEASWHEVKFKYVKFQKVQSLTIFIDGEDEDYHTVVDKIVVVGISGESKEMGKLAKVDLE